MQFSDPVAREDLQEWEEFSGRKLTEVDRRRLSFFYTNKTWIQQISTIAKLFRVLFGLVWCDLVVTLHYIVLTCNVVIRNTSLTVASRVLSLTSGKPLLSI
jgi:hypothetical protein